MRTLGLLFLEAPFLAWGALACLFVAVELASGIGFFVLPALAAAGAGVAGRLGAPPLAAGAVFGLLLGLETLAVLGLGRARARRRPAAAPAAAEPAPVLVIRPRPPLPGLAGEPAPPGAGAPQPPAEAAAPLPLRRFGG